MALIKELSVVVRTYTDRDGHEKKVWKNIGAIHISKEGREYMVLDPLINLAAIPRKEGDDRIFVSMFEPKPREDQTPIRSKSGEFDDIRNDIPY